MMKNQNIMLVCCNGIISIISHLHKEYISPKTTVRVGLVQWQMRSYKTLDDLFEQVEFFVDAVSDYKSDFVLFPEYFNAPLMSKYNDKGESQAIRGLAIYG